MKSLIVGAAIILGQVYAQAGEVKNWVCNSGDYHISLKAAEGDKSFNFSICEFTTCRFNDLRQTAILKSQNSRSYIYKSPNAVAPEELHLNYENPSDLRDVRLVVDGSDVQTFDGCSVE